MVAETEQFTLRCLAPSRPTIIAAAGIKLE
jgi:hypothetical protein